MSESEILTREEYEAYVWHMDGIESDAAKILAHDAALRTEVANWAITAGNVARERDAARTEADALGAALKAIAASTRLLSGDEHLGEWCDWCEDFAPPHTDDCPVALARVALGVP